MRITEQQFYDMLDVKEHMNFTNRIKELVFDKDGREKFYSKLVAAQQKTDELSQAVTDAQQTKDLSDDAVNATK